MFFPSEGIDHHGGAIAIGRPFQHAVATGIVDILFLVGGASIPFHQMIEQIVRERDGGAAIAAAGDVVLAGYCRLNLPVTTWPTGVGGEWQRRENTDLGKRKSR